MTTQQVGRCGELLVQYELLKLGFESSALTTDSGIDLVVYSHRRKRAVTIQVKTNLKPKPAGGRGKSALGWWIDDKFPAQLAAFVDLSSERIWLFNHAEIDRLAQQHSNGSYQLYFYVDEFSKSRANPKSFQSRYHNHLFEKKVHKFL